MSKGLRVRNTLVNGGMTGIDQKIDKVFAYKQGNNYSTAKRRVKASNPNTEAQQLIRNIFAQTSSGWGALTEEQRALWNSAAPLWVNTGIFGDKKQTGKNLYTGVNIRLATIGRALIVEPGTKETTLDLESGSVEALDSTVKVLMTGTGFTAQDTIVCAVSKQLSTGTSIVQETTKITSFNGGGPFPAETNITAAYTAKYGSLIEGKKIGYEISVITAGGNKIVLYTNLTAITLL